MMTDHESPDEPAGAMPRASRRMWIFTAVGVAALTAVASYLGWQQANQPVRWQDVGFTIDSPFEATATYDVFLYTDQPVTCHVRALSESFAEVGLTSQRVDPSDGKSQRLTTEVITTELATTAVVKYCEVDN